MHTCFTAVLNFLPPQWILTIGSEDPGLLLNMPAESMALVYKQAHIDFVRLESITFDEETYFSMDYEAIPCLFGWEIKVTADWREESYYLPEFFTSEIIAEATAEAHRIEELAKVEKLFDGIVMDMTQDD